MKTRGITEGAVFCALAVMLALASYYVPFLVILMFFIPVPMVILGQRQGLRVSIIASLAATIIIGLFLGPVNAISFGVLLFFVGCSLGYAYHKNSPVIKKIIVGYLGFSLVLVSLIASYQFLMGISFTGELFQILEASTKEVLIMYENTGMMDESQLLLTKEAMVSFVNSMKMALPGSFLIMPLIFSFINIAISDGMLKRLGYKVEGIKPLAQWKIPDSLKYFLLIFIIGSLTIDVFKITAIPEIYIFTVMNLVYLVYLVMGLSVIFDFMEYKKVNNKALKVLVVFLAMIFQFMVTMLGVLDTYGGIRKIFRRGSEVK